MSAIKIFYNKEGRPAVAELSYRDYFALRQQADSGAQLKKTMESVASILDVAQVQDSAEEKVAVGIEASKVIDLREALGESGPVATEVKNAEVPAPLAEKKAVAPEPVAEKSAATPAAKKQVASVAPAAKEQPEQKAVSAVATASAEKKGARRSGVALAMPRAVVNYFETHDPDGGLMEVFRHYYQAIGAQCSGSLSVTLQEHHICLWNYDEWKMFAFLDIMDGRLRLSVDASLAPEHRNMEMWVSPKWMGTKKMARFSLDEFSSNTLEVLINAFKAA